MIGFSVYLNKEIDNEIKEYLKLMKLNGFSGVFTSLHIPEEDSKSYRNKIIELAKFCRYLNLQLTIDVDENSLNLIGYSFNNVEQLAELGVTALRIDYGLTNEQIAKLSYKIKIALNASTILKKDIEELKQFNARFDSLQAWHNYYPRPETGLDFNWYKQKNIFLKKSGFKTMGFVPGDKNLRGPLNLGLPTVEKHRNLNPLFSSIELIDSGNTDLVYIGDPRISDKLMNQFRQYFSEDILELSVNSSIEFPDFMKNIVHSRKDLSRDVIRIEEGRIMINKKIYPMNIVKRNKGTITLDNLKYGRYMGELQIVKNDLPKDERVNTIGRVNASDIDLLDIIKPYQKIVFKIGD
ncbi:DUF871 domain-containing protein [Companilactobacillus sp. DQM5]|uniref:DUF871 domain-containing protein n=1 Tax=Companilactobacillus sp. DQM5 TaxID=3463359 RepID=UPI004057F72E